MNINFDEAFARMEMDMAWDNYLDECHIKGEPAMSFGEWKKYYTMEHNM